MANQINNQEIGAYVSRLIEQEFDSARQFCIKYLQAGSDKEPTEETIRNVSPVWMTCSTSWQHRTS